jgi:hypothetical protein
MTMRTKMPAVQLSIGLGLVILVVLAIKFLPSSRNTSSTASTQEPPATAHTVLAGKTPGQNESNSNIPGNPTKPQAKETSPEMTKAIEHAKEKISLEKSQKIERYLVGLIETLGLSPEQEENIRSILVERDAQQQEIGIKIKRTRNGAEMAELRKTGAVATLNAEE